MLSIRKSMWETNSSSCHQLIISREDVMANSFLERLVIKHNEPLNGKYWRDINRIDDPQLKLNYIVESIRMFCETSADSYNPILDFFKSIIKLKGMLEKTTTVEIDLESFTDDGIMKCPDIPEEIVKEIIEMIDSNDIDKLRRFLFSKDSCIATADQAFFPDGTDIPDPRSPLMNPKDDDVDAKFEITTSWY